MAEHTANTGSFPHRFGTIDTSVYRAEIIAFRDQSTGRRRSLANILNRQLLELERSPDRPGLRDLAMQTIRRLASA